MIVYVLCAIAEVVLYAAKVFVENLVNRHFAVSQMAISTGFIYGDVVRGVNLVWGILAIAVLLVGALYYFLRQKGNRE